MFGCQTLDWSATKIDFYIDGILVSTHTQNIPTAPANILMSIFGTNRSILAA